MNQTFLKSFLVFSMIIGTSSFSLMPHSAAQTSRATMIAELHDFASLAAHCEKTTHTTSDQVILTRCFALADLMKRYRKHFANLKDVPNKHLRELYQRCRDTLALQTAARGPGLRKHPATRERTLSDTIATFVDQYQDALVKKTTGIMLLKRIGFRSLVEAICKSVDHYTSPEKGELHMPCFTQRVSTIPTRNPLKKETLRKIMIAFGKVTGNLVCDELLPKGVRSQEQSLTELVSVTLVGAVLAACMLVGVKSFRQQNIHGIDINPGKPIDPVNLTLDTFAKLFLCRWYIKKNHKYYWLANIAAMTVPFFKGSTFLTMRKTDDWSRRDAFVNGIIDTAESAIIYDAVPLGVEKLLPKRKKKRHFAPAHRRTACKRLFREIVDKWVKELTLDAFTAKA